MNASALALVCAVAFVVPACSGASRGASAESGELTVFAAASLRSVLVEVVAGFAADHPGVTVAVSTDSSAALATQIEQGAPADVFLSADMTNARRLVDAGLVAGDVVVFAGNLLTIIVPEGNPARLASPADLARPGIKVVAAGDEVPISRYAAQLVENLARQSGYPGDFAAGYAANIVSREDSVAGAVAKIELGEADAGIVYVTDAAASGKVDMLAVPTAANVTVTYGGVVIDRGSGDAAGATFLEWLVGPSGQDILASFGFVRVPARALSLVAG